MGKRSVAITLTPRQREILEGFTRTKKATQQLVERCRVVLGSAAGRYNDSQAASLGVDRQLVRRWRIVAPVAWKHWAWPRPRARRTWI